MVSWPTDSWRLSRAHSDSWCDHKLTPGRGNMPARSLLISQQRQGAFSRPGFQSSGQRRVMRRLTTSRNEARSIERGLRLPGDRESDPKPMMAPRSIPERLPACWPSVPFLKLPANRWVSRKLPLNKGRRSVVGRFTTTTSGSARLRTATSSSWATDATDVPAITLGADWAAAEVATARFAVRHRRCARKPWWADRAATGMSATRLPSSM